MSALMRPAGTGWHHRLMLVKVFGLVLWVRLLLSLRSYRPVLAAIGKLEGNDNARRNPLAFVWAVENASRFIPGASCLTQALAVKWLMVRANQPCTIRIGVAASDKGVEAHAWIMESGRVLIGDRREDISRFTPIAEL